MTKKACNINKREKRADFCPIIFKLNLNNKKQNDKNEQREYE